MKVSPSKSKDLNQLDLLDADRPQPIQIDPLTMLPTIKGRATLLRAIHLAQEVSGLEDKEIYGPLKIDPSHWTRMKNGKAGIPMDQTFINFMKLVGNEIPLIWIAEACGYDWRTISKHRAGLERENETLKQELADHKRALKLMMEAR